MSFKVVVEKEAEEKTLIVVSATRQKNVRQKNKRCHFSVLHFSVWSVSVAETTIKAEEDIKEAAH
jgi:hypothetical protein